MLDKGFLRNRTTTLFEVSKRRLIVGLLLILLLSVLFFNFFHLLRIGYVLLDASISNDFEPYSPIPSHEFFYKFLLGFIAIYFSFSIVFDYWFRRPKKFLSRFNYKRTSILNQQRITNWFFLHWFLRIFLIVGMLALDFPEVNLYPRYFWVIVLFFIVFSGQIWMSVQSIIKRKKALTFIILLVTLAGSSFLISKTTALDFERVEKAILKHNVIYQNEIHVVESDVYSKRKYLYLSCDIIIPNKNDRRIIFEEKTINPDKLKEEIFLLWTQFSEGEIPYINHTLFIDKDVKMSVVYDLKRKMNEIGVKTMSFSVKKKNEKVPFYYKSKYDIRFNLESTLIDDTEIDSDDVIEIKVSAEGFHFNGKRSDEKELAKLLKMYHQKEGVHSVRILFKRDTRFEEYFQVFESSKKAIEELREELSKKAYGVSYTKLSSDLKKPIKEKYFWHIIDRQER